MKKNKGITLVALVVTIIVLLILAAVSINLVLGENGIIRRAKIAKEQTEIDSIKENIQLKITDKKMDNEEYITEEDFAKILNEYGEIEEYEGEKYLVINDKDYKIKITDIYNSNIKYKEKGLEVGDYVYYNVPGSTYTWQKDLANFRWNSDYVLDSREEGTCHLSSWRVLNIRDDGTVDLISEKATEGVAYLADYKGYNNGVKLLNDACDILYSNIEKGISARSIKIEDIEDKLKQEVYDNRISAYGDILYGTEIEETINGKYPLIYAQENLSNINGNYVENKLGRSEQTSFYTGDESTSRGDLKPTVTIWALSSDETMASFFKGDGIGEDNLYYSIFSYNDKEYNSYWIASRGAVQMFSNKISYGFYLFVYGRVSATFFGDSSLGGQGASYGLRPILTLNKDIITGSEKEGWKIQ